MDWNVAATLALTAVAVVLFATEKVRMDAVAILVLSALVLLGRVKSPVMFLLLMFAVVSLISPFVNNTPVVAVFIPLVIATAQKIKFPASKALIPLSFVSQMAGVCTLIGTSTNLLVDAIARQQGFAGFGMFSFAPFGLILLAVGWAYLLLFGRWLLPAHQRDSDEAQSLGKYVAELRVPSDSPLIGQTTNSAAFGSEYGVYVAGLLRGGERLSTPRDQEIRAQDMLLVRGEPQHIRLLREKFALKHFSISHFKRLHNDENPDPEFADRDDDCAQFKMDRGEYSDFGRALEPRQFGHRHPTPPPVGARAFAPD